MGKAKLTSFHIMPISTQNLPYLFLLFILDQNSTSIYREYLLRIEATYVCPFFPSWEVSNFVIFEMLLAISLAVLFAVLFLQSKP